VQVDKKFWRGYLKTTIRRILFLSALFTSFVLNSYAKFPENTIDASKLFPYAVKLEVKKWFDIGSGQSGVVVYPLKNERALILSYESDDNNFRSGFLKLDLDTGRKTDLMTGKSQEIQRQYTSEYDQVIVKINCRLGDENGKYDNNDVSVIFYSFKERKITHTLKFKSCNKPGNCLELKIVGYNKEKTRLLIKKSAGQEFAGDEELIKYEGLLWVGNGKAVKADDKSEYIPAEINYGIRCYNYFNKRYIPDGAPKDESITLKGIGDEFGCCRKRWGERRA
jgi:hypothetical protein